MQRWPCTPVSMHACFLEFHESRSNYATSLSRVCTFSEASIAVCVVLWRCNLSYWSISVMPWVQMCKWTSVRVACLTPFVGVDVSSSLSVHESCACTQSAAWARAPSSQYRCCWSAPLFVFGRVCTVSMSMTDSRLGRKVAASIYLH